MRIGQKIIIISSLLAGTITAIAYVLLVQLNFPGLPTKGIELVNSSMLMISFGIAIFLVIAVAMIFLIRSVTNPIRKLRDAADKIARGDLDAKVYTKGTMEVYDLAVSINNMANKLWNLNSKYRDLYENSSSLYRTIGLDGTILSCSRSYAERFGYTMDEVIGTHFNKYTAPQDARTMMREFETWEQKKTSKNIEIWLKGKDETTFPAIISVNNVYDENGHLVGYNNIIRDISEIYEARNKIEQEKMIRLQLAEAKKMEKLRDEFSSMVTHELKTPLTPIMGHCEMLKEPGLLGNLNQEQSESVDKIAECALRLERLVGDVMLAQRLEIGQMKFDKQKFEVSKIMSDVDKDYSQIMKEKQIEFVNSTQENLDLFTDKNRVRQIIDNLIQNAVDFTPKNNGKIEIGAKSEDGKVVFYVKDNGIGIPKDAQPTMFRKFYQVDASHRRKHSGTGLGLVICKGIVEGLGGKIWFESEPGKSTCFYFSIPEEVYWKARVA